MAIIRIGKIRPTYKNEYSDNKVYERLDVVKDEKGAYISIIEDNKGNKPNQNKSKWIEIMRDAKNMFLPQIDLTKEYNDF